MHISAAHGPEYCRSCHVRLGVGFAVVVFLETLPKSAPLILPTKKVSLFFRVFNKLKAISNVDHSDFFFVSISPSPFFFLSRFGEALQTLQVVHHIVFVETLASRNGIETSDKLGARDSFLVKGVDAQCL